MAAMQNQTAPLFCLSPDTLEQVFAAYYAESQAEQDPEAWRSENPLEGWYQLHGARVLDPEGGAAPSRVILPVELASGSEPLPFIQLLYEGVVTEGSLDDGQKLLIWEAQPTKLKDTTIKKSHWRTNAGSLPRLSETSHWYIGLALGDELQEMRSNVRVARGNTSGIPCVWADIDFAHPVHKDGKKVYPPDREACLGFLDGLALPPTLIVDTGHGLQAYWLFEKFWRFSGEEGRAEAERLLKDWHVYIAGSLKEQGWDVDNMSDLTRVMRLPGTLNVKEPETPAPVTVLEHRGRRYSRWELEGVSRAYSAHAAQKADRGDGAAPPVTTAKRRGGKPPKLSNRLSDEHKAEILERYFGDYSPDAEGMRRCGDIYGSPISHGAGSGSFVVWAKGSWHEHKTKTSGDIIDLIIAREGLAMDQVKPWLVEQGYLPEDGGGPSTDDSLATPSLPRNSRGLGIALDFLGLELRQNVRTDRLELRAIGDDAVDGLFAEETWRPDADGWASPSEGMLAFLREEIEMNLLDTNGKPLTFSEAKFKQSAAALGHMNSVDPVKEWLESLEPCENVEMSDTLLIDCVGAEDNELNRAVGHRLLAAAVVRTYQPGMSLPWWPVLIAEEEPALAEFCRRLVPVNRPEWFSESANLREGPERMREAIGGAFIVQYRDLQSSYGADWRRVQGIGTDRGRSSHAARISDTRRGWLPIGTSGTGGQGALPDDALGLKRFVAVPCPGIGANSAAKVRHVRNYVTENLDRLWSEALATGRRIMAGEEYLEIPAHLEKARDLINWEFSGINEVLANAVSVLTKEMRGKDQCYSLEYLMDEAQWYKERPEAIKDLQGQRRFADLLKAAGWKREGSGGASPFAVFWCPPSD